MPVLNYRYGLLPTRPQRRWLGRTMRESRVQWNRACRTRRRLLRAIACGNIAHLLGTLTSIQKSDTNSNRAAAIQRMAEGMSVDPKDAAVLYDLAPLCRGVIELRREHVDLAVLAADLGPILQQEIEARKVWRHTSGERGKHPPTPLRFRLIDAVSTYAGLEAKRHMDTAWTARKGRRMAAVRFAVSGSSTNANFERACSPSPEQRRNGNSGDPRFKRRVEAFGWQTQPPKSGNGIGHVIDDQHVIVKGLPTGLDRVAVLWHRPLPPSAKIKRCTVQQDALGCYAVFTIDVSDSDYAIEQRQPTVRAGFDPGAKTALTGAYEDTVTGEQWSATFDCRPLEASEDKLAAAQRRIARMTGPDRRTGRKPSRRWRRADALRRKLHARVRGRRKDLHHRASRAMADLGFVAIGKWEGPRQIAGREAVKRGAAAYVEAAGKGVRKQRRGARDRGIATLRRMAAEKCERSGTVLVANATERMTTRVCSTCGSDSGPKNDLSVREWTCVECQAHHDRDENAARNILRRAIWEAEQASRGPAHGPASAARGAVVQPVREGARKTQVVELTQLTRRERHETDTLSASTVEVLERARASPVATRH